MMNNKRWISSLIVLGTLVIGTIIIPTRAETVAIEQPVEGGNVLLEKYCKNVANGALDAQPVEVLASNNATPTPVP